jgi:hypothetical protein
MAQIVSHDPNFNGKDDRSDAWVISCDVWDNVGCGGIILPLNPESLEVRLPLRGSEAPMYAGRRIVRSRDPRANTHFDYFSVTFKFNSGNIQPLFNQQYVDNTRNRSQGTTEILPPRKYSNNLYGRYTSTYGGKARPNGVPGLYKGNPEIPVGVQNLYALFSLVNEAMILEAADVGVGDKHYTKLNRIRVATNSLVFPSLIFYGFFEESGLQWSESADNYNNFDTSFNLVVTHTVPHLRGSQLQALLASYKCIYSPKSEYDFQYALDVSRGGLGSSQPAGTCADDTGGDQQADPPQPKTWADSIRGFGNKYFGNPQNGERGKVRDGLSGAVSSALSNIDPTYASKVQAKSVSAQPIAMNTSNLSGTTA